MTALWTGIEPLLGQVRRAATAGCAQLAVTDTSVLEHDGDRREVLALPDAVLAPMVGA